MFESDAEGCANPRLLGLASPQNALKKSSKIFLKAILVEQQEGHSYDFGRFRLKTAERVLLREGEPVPLTPKVFDILITLVENRGRVVQKDDLMKRVWPSTFVEEGNLTQNVSLLRKALGESAGGAQFIETVPRRGYRFVAQINESWAESHEVALPAVLKEEVPAAVGNGNGQHQQLISAETLAVAPATRPISGVTTTSISNRLAPLNNRFGVVLTAVVVVAAIAAFAYFNGRSKAGDLSPDAIQSIAVLPFIDEAGDADTEYLNDKIAESLINSLSKIPQLRVVPRSVVASYKGKQIDPRQIGKDLNVRGVVTGRMRKHGDIISIQADFIDLENVAQLWGQHYDHKLADVILVQEDISRDIFENLRLKLNVEEKKQLEAYRLYLKGRNAWNKRTADELQQGIDFFNQAIAIDPNYAAAYAGLADCYNMLVVYGRLQPKEGFPKAKDAAMKALDIDENQAEAHSSLAFIKFRWDWIAPKLNASSKSRSSRSRLTLPHTSGTARTWLRLSVLTRRLLKPSELKNSSRYHLSQVRTSAGSTTYPEKTISLSNSARRFSSWIRVRFPHVVILVSLTRRRECIPRRLMNFRLA